MAAVQQDEERFEPVLSEAEQDQYTRILRAASHIGYKGDVEWEYDTTSVDKGTHFFFHRAQNAQEALIIADHYDQFGFQPRVVGDIVMLPSEGDANLRRVLVRLLTLATWDKDIHFATFTADVLRQFGRERAMGHRKGDIVGTVLGKLEAGSDRARDILRGIPGGEGFGIIASDQVGEFRLASEDTLPTMLPRIAELTQEANDGLKVMTAHFKEHLGVYPHRLEFAMAPLHAFSDFPVRDRKLGANASAHRQVAFAVLNVQEMRPEEREVLMQHLQSFGLEGVGENFFDPRKGQLRTIMVPLSVLGQAAARKPGESLSAQEFPLMIGVDQRRVIPLDLPQFGHARYGRNPKGPDKVLYRNMNAEVASTLGYLIHEGGTRTV